MRYIGLITLATVLFTAGCKGPDLTGLYVVSSYSFECSVPEGLGKHCTCAPPFTGDCGGAQYECEELSDSDGAWESECTAGPLFGGIDWEYIFPEYVYIETGEHEHVGWACRSTDADSCDKHWAWSRKATGGYSGWSMSGEVGDESCYDWSTESNLTTENDTIRIEYVSQYLIVDEDELDDCGHTDDTGGEYSGALSELVEAESSTKSIDGDLPD